MKFLPLLWRGLMRRRVRTTFTFLSIVVAFFLFGILMAVRNGFASGIEIAGQNRLITIHKTAIIYPLPLRYLERIRATPGVRFVTHFSWFGGVYQDPKNFFPQIAAEPDGLLRMYPEYRLSEAEEERWLATRTGALAGRKLAERYGWEIGDKIPIQPTFWRPTDGGGDTYEFDLVGIYDGATVDVDTTQLYFHYEYLMERVGDPGTVGWYVLEVDEPERADRIADAIDRQFANSPAETKTTTEKAFVQSFAAQVGDTGAMLSAISGVVFFVILLIAANTMAQSVRERTREVGVMKTLGYPDSWVMMLVLGESVLLCGAGAATGLALVLATTPALGKMLESFLPIFYVPTESLLVGLGLAVILGFASGGIPAWSAQRLSVVDALRRG